MGYVYCRAEYPIAVANLNIAIEQAREFGFLGNNVFGTDFSFDLEVRMGAGAFVCGEETALIASIEGKRGEPRPRPPFPAVRGVWGKPTNNNNVETYAVARKSCSKVRTGMPAWVPKKAKAPRPSPSQATWSTQV